jgi:predicted DNA-binding antitoxin AbrB/MazE fold protein
MSQIVQAVFENGVLRPLGELSLRPNQQVVLHIEEPTEDVEDREFLEYCRAEGDAHVSLQRVRQILSKIPGTMTQACIEERDEA